MTKSDNIDMQLRPARYSDLLFLYNLKNEPSVLETAFNQTLVTLDGHTKWFMSKLQNKDSHLFIIEQDSTSVGQVRIDLDGSVGEIDVAISPAYRGHGHASWGIAHAVEQVFAERTDISTVIAHIKPENIASQKAFEKAGFTGNKLVNFAGHQCIEMRKEHGR